jgi:hypothetical protein
MAGLKRFAKTCLGLALVGIALVGAKFASAQFQGRNTSHRSNRAPRPPANEGLEFTKTLPDYDFADENSAPPTFSSERGYFENPFDLELNSTAGSSNIYYTTVSNPRVLKLGIGCL